jgi:hypothetical protein
MSTRGAYGFYKGGISKITYNHFDSYPECLGKDILKYMKAKSIEEMNNDFAIITMVKSNDIPTTEQFIKCAEYYNDTVSSKSPEEWYCLLRETQGDLDASAKIGLMIDTHTFLENSLFCKWAYIINLDTNVLEIYKGFQKKKSDTRYQPEYPGNSGYWGCRLIQEISLKNSNADEQFDALIKRVNGENE